MRHLAIVVARGRQAGKDEVAGFEPCPIKRDVLLHALYGGDEREAPQKLLDSMRNLIRICAQALLHGGIRRQIVHRVDHRVGYRVQAPP